MSLTRGTVLLLLLIAAADAHRGSFGEYWERQRRHRGHRWERPESGPGTTAPTPCNPISSPVLAPSPCTPSPIPSPVAATPSPCTPSPIPSPCMPSPVPSPVAATPSPCTPAPGPQHSPASTFPYKKCDRRHAKHGGWRVHLTDAARTQRGYRIQLQLDGTAAAKPLVRLELRFKNELHKTVTDVRVDGLPATHYSFDTRHPLFTLSGINIPAGQQHEFTFQIDGSDLSQLCGGDLCQYATYTTYSRSGPCPVAAFPSVQPGRHY